jgi:eukaryotic-like serine/threonine-protein kinase
MATTDTLIDTLFDGRYRIRRKLGSGGMADVYLAEDQELGRRVAIKILDDRHAHDGQFVERFRREAKNAAGLSHPSIVSIYDRGEAEGTYYIAMEYLEGRSLKELILSRGPAPVRIAIDYARQILGALRFAHRNGIVHRDIKPHNVLVDPEGRVKVTDFGIARAGASQMTEAGSIVGTAQYLSPEQAKGTPVDQRSDIYSLGIVLYELLTGEVPFKGDTPVEIAMKHLSTVPEPPSARRQDVPHDLDLVVMRALAKDPDDRYANAEEMDADLERVSRGLGVSRETADAATQIMRAPAEPTAVTNVARPSTGPAAGYTPPPPVYYDYEEPSRGRPVWPWLLALAFVIAAGFGAYYLYQQVSSLSSNTAVVPFVQGLRGADAVRKIRDAKLKPVVVRDFSETVERTFVISQDPSPGDRIDKGNAVTIHVSKGKPQTDVPDVVGKSATDAVALLKDANLEPKVVEVPSDKPQGTVTAQEPRTGRVDEGTTVRINVSKGPKPVGVPSVLGLSFDDASSQLQGAGFAVRRVDVDSNQPAGTVVDQTPDPNTFAAKGSTVTLSVAKGPTKARVPDVTSQDQDTARATLEGSGFKVRVQTEDTTDASLDGVVLTQDPGGGTDADPGSTVTITVGHFTP